MACSDLVASDEEIASLLDELERVSNFLPEDIAAEPEKAEFALLRFAELTGEINRLTEEAHEAYELPCKWPYVDDGDYEQVFERVYAPHIAHSARLVHLTRAFAELLASRGSKDVIGRAERELNRLAKRIETGLRAQVAVCEADFDESTCDHFAGAVNEALSREE